MITQKQSLLPSPQAQVYEVDSKPRNQLSVRVLLLLFLQLLT